MLDIQIRSATLEDLPILESFEQAVIEYERPFAPNLKPDPIEYYPLEDLIEDEYACFLVAEKEGRLIASGYASIEKSKPTKKERYHAYLGFMFVVPEFRGKGVNGQIIQALIDWAKNHKITEIVLDVYAKNESALKSYRKFGFEPELLNMRFNTEERNN